ncbi:Hypothetical predicted protein [Olea europaea subsp. europaea]|uniref:Uncharacterized protein n=1 Tax=Olea europaea subsp. europaea TaxID=158383 RepID=A0A8S0P8T5_OLEEU|nr:Hypothetical predicted protein [Olea europaea subsp. europaea]
MQPIDVSKYPEAAKYRVKGLDHAFKLDELFRDVTATGARAWAPTSGVMHPLYSQNTTITEDDDSAENEQFDGDHEEIGYSSRQDKVVESTRKRLRKKKNKQSTTTRLCNQLEELREAVKNRSSYIHTDLPGCSVQEKYPEAAKYRVKGLDHAFKLDELFRDVTATGARAWAPTSGVMHPLYSQNTTITEDDDSAENEQFDGDHEEIGYSSRQDKVVESTRKRLRKKKNKQSTTTRLCNQLEELREAVKNRSSYIHTDLPGCSVQEVMDKMATLPGCEPMTPLFKLGLGLFTKKANREIFVALKELEYQIEWLKDQQYQL